MRKLNLKKLFDTRKKKIIGGIAGAVVLLVLILLVVLPSKNDAAPAAAKKQTQTIKSDDTLQEVSEKIEDQEKDTSEKNDEELTKLESKIQ